MNPLSNPRSSDAAYLSAVKAGDMATAQQMVDEAARAAGVPTIGVNINDGEQSFTDQILNGDKTIETRDSENNALAGLVGQRIAIVRTGKGRAKVVGYTTVGEPIRYTSKSQFDADYNRHLVSGGKYGFKGFKIGYPMLDVERIDAYDAPPATGVIKTRPIHAPIERDEQGNVIPLLQRFNPNKTSIRNPMKPLIMNPKRGSYAGGTGFWRKSMGMDEQKPAQPRQQAEDARDSMYVEYLHPLPGENRFTMGGTDFVYVWAQYPDGRRDIGVYAFSGDVTYGYRWFRTYYNLDGERRTQDNMDPAARAKLNRMDAGIE